MYLDVGVLQSAALEDERGAFDFRIGRDDPTITYEEFIVYYMCRYASGSDYINPDIAFQRHKEFGKLDRDWLEMSASKTHKMEIIHKWDEIFPKYKQELATKEAFFKAHGVELPPKPDESQDDDRRH